MKDFTKLKHNLEMATDILTSMNEEVQGLPDQYNAESLEQGDPVFQVLSGLIQGFVEFKLYFDTAYDPFKSIVEQRIAGSKMLQQIVDEASESKDRE